MRMWPGGLLQLCQVHIENIYSITIQAPFVFHNPQACLT